MRQQRRIIVLINACAFILKTDIVVLSCAGEHELKFQCGQFDEN